MSNDNEIRKILKIIENHENRLKKIERIVKGEGRKVSTADIGDRIKKLSEKLRINKDKIKELYDIEDKTLILIKVIGENEKEKTQNITLLVLFGYKYLFEIENIPAQEIRRNVAENGISLCNFANHLNEVIPSFIRRNGKTRSPKTLYRLTIQGEVKAKEIIKKICGEK